MLSIVVPSNALGLDNQWNSLWDLWAFVDSNVQRSCAIVFARFVCVNAVVQQDPHELQAACSAKSC